MPANPAHATMLAFVDTNILLYAHDRQAGEKQVQAATLLAGLWENRTGILSSQILQEFSSMQCANSSRHSPFLTHEKLSVTTALGYCTTQALPTL